MRYESRPTVGYQLERVRIQSLAERELLRLKATDEEAQMRRRILQGRHDKALESGVYSLVLPFAHADVYESETAKGPFRKFATGFYGDAILFPNEKRKGGPTHWDMYCEFRLLDGRGRQNLILTRNSLEEGDVLEQLSIANAVGHAAETNSTRGQAGVRNVPIGNIRGTKNDIKRHLFHMFVALPTDQLATEVSFSYEMDRYGDFMSQNLEDMFAERLSQPYDGFGSVDPMRPHVGRPGPTLDRLVAAHGRPPINF